MYHIEYSKKAQKQIKKLDKQIQRLLFAWIDKHLEGTDNPRANGKGLTGNHANEWRYRIGDYRLICDIQDDKMIVLALEFGHRKDIYWSLESKMTKDKAIDSNWSDARTELVSK